MIKKKMNSKSNSNKIKNNYRVICNKTKKAQLLLCLTNIRLDKMEFR